MHSAQIIANAPFFGAVSPQARVVALSHMRSHPF
jgi:hypothetical protein